MFLYQVAQDIISRKNELKNFCIVFPNKRTGVYFKKYFAQIVGKSSWAPDIYTIDSLIKGFVRHRNPDKHTSLFMLYDIFKKQFAGSDKDFYRLFTFDKFYTTGEIILKDFNELDNYLVEVRDIYQNIENFEKIDYNLSYLNDEQKAMLKEYWLNFSIEKSSEEKERFVELWNSLPKIYDKFTEELKEKRLAYNGLRNRELVELIKNNLLNFSSFDNYIFVGFNALNKSEKIFLGHIQKIGKAKFYWDYDNYYIKDPKQEAGLFLRENLKKLPNQFAKGYNNLLTNNKKIKLLGVPLEVGQAKALPTILQDLKIDFANTQDLEKTVIVIPDEQMLFPVLHSIPPEIEKVNVTIGFPFKDTILFALLENWLRLQNSYQLRKKYFYKDVLGIIKHPSISAKLKDLGKGIENHIETTNMVYILPDYLLNYRNSLLTLLFTPMQPNSKTEILTNLLNILFAIFDKSQDEITEEQNLLNEYIFQVYLEIKRLKEIIENTESIEFSTQLIIRLLNQVIYSIRIPFEGKTIDGLQITTLMETRNIDFENVIILSMNEGIVPEKSMPTSFISQTMRMAFDLPVVKFKDSIFAYFFYRIIQRAKNVTILYNSNSGSSNSNGELSRFVQQLQFETDLKIDEKLFGQKLVPTSTEPIVIEKNDEILTALNQYLVAENRKTKSFSASAVNTFIDCSLRFYFKYIAQIKEAKTIEEEISPITFGNILHNSIEKIYADRLKAKKSNFIDPTDIDKVKKLVPEYVMQAFKEEYNLQKEQEFQFEGANIIIREAIIRNIYNILKVDKKYAPFKVIDLEEKYGYSSELELDNDLKIRIFGIFDRVDEKDLQRRVIDYKTGSAKKDISKLGSLFNGETTRNKAIFQVLYYSLIMQQKFGNTDFKPGIYDIRSMTEADFSPDVSIGKQKLERQFLEENLKIFKQKLSEKMSDLFNPNIAFSQTENEDNCKYCAYKVLCNKG